MAEDAGALIVRAGLIAEEQLLAARQAQAAHGGTIGEHLVLAGFSEDETLAEFYRTRLMVPRVTMRQLARIGKDIIAKIPADMATELRCVPVGLDRDGNLTMAMADPSATNTVDEIAFFTGYYVVRSVATQSQMAWALAHYYGRLTPLGEKLLRDPEGVLIPGPMPPMAALQGPAANRPRSVTNRVHEERHHAMVPMVSPFRRRAPSETPVRPIAAGEPWIQQEQGGASDAGLPTAGPEPRSLSLPTPEDRQVISSPIPVLIEEPSSLPPHLQARQGVVRPQQVISFLHDDATPVRPMTVARPVENAPELSPRSGEMHVATGPITRPESRLPAVLVALPPDDSPGLLDDDRTPMDPLEFPGESAVVEPFPDEELAGDTLAHAMPADMDYAAAPDTDEYGPDDGEPDDEDDFAPTDRLLERPLTAERKRAAGKSAGAQRRTQRRLQRTMLGLGFAASDQTRESDMEAEADVWDEERESGPIPDSALSATTSKRARPKPLDHVPTLRAASTPPVIPARPAISVVDSLQRAAEAAAEAHGRVRDTRSSDVRAPVLPDADRPGQISGAATGKPGTITNEPTERMERPSASIADDIDEWGPPGTTIPPPFLGAIVPVEDSDHDGIPLDTSEFSDELSDVPLLPLPDTTHEPAVPEPVPELLDSSAAMRRDRSGETVQAPLSLYDSEDVTPAVLRAFENSQGALAEVLRYLQLADTRDAVITILVDHLHESHEHVAFFAVKSGSLEPWKIRGSALYPDDDPVRLGRLWLRLDFSSTFHDVVATRLPFRGPITDEPSREFIIKTFGSCASTMLGLPVTVRERVVGVLYGDTSRKRVFVENLGVMARAAGGALERIIKTQKG